MVHCSMQTELDTYLNGILAINMDCASQCLQLTATAMCYSHSVFVGYAGSSAQVYAIAA